MHFSKGSKFFIIILLSMMLSHIPNIAVAEILMNPGEMVTTGSFVEEFNREQTYNKIQNYLSKTEVRQKLIDNGLSPEEASSRLASLSNQELQQLSVQVDKAQYGGDILVAILIVVLIIYLIKRI